MLDTPSTQMVDKTLRNSKGEWLKVKATYRAQGVRWFVVDAEADRLFEYLADRVNGEQEFLDFIHGNIHLDESQFIELLKAFDFPLHFLADFGGSIKG